MDGALKIPFYTRELQRYHPATAGFCFEDAYMITVHWLNLIKFFELFYVHHEKYGRASVGR